MLNLCLYQEEDLFTITSGLPLKKDGDEKCLSMLNVVEEIVTRQLHACKSPSHKKRSIEGVFFNYFFLLLNVTLMKK